MAGPVTPAALSTAATRITTSALKAPSGLQSKLVIVGLSSTPPKTTQSLVKEAVSRGFDPVKNILTTTYDDLVVHPQGVVTLGEEAGSRLVAGWGSEAHFLYRGGGNLKPDHAKTIAAIQSVDGAHNLADLPFIESAGSKAITFEKVSEAGLSLPTTITARSTDEAVQAFDDIKRQFGGDTVVLKKVNSLGGKDVHFPKSHDEIHEIMSETPGEYVVQEYLAHAKDQDVRIHMVYNSDLKDFEIANSYVRNRKPGARTPNLANDGYATLYVPSPWESNQALEAARVLSNGSSVPPIHVGLDLFPRRAIHASVVEANAQLADDVRRGVMSLDDAMAASRDTAVIGEAASSAGTKGTEVVLDGANPVAEKIIDEVVRRMHGSSGVSDAAASATALRSSSARTGLGPLPGLRA